MLLPYQFVSFPLVQNLPGTPGGALSRQKSTFHVDEKVAFSAQQFASKLGFLRLIVESFACRDLTPPKLQLARNASCFSDAGVC
jgi:hypothetical protein